MKIFIDSANVEEIKLANDMGVICGVTTNPSLIAKEHRNFKELIKEIVAIIDGPINVAVVSLQSDDMIEEAEELAAINEKLVIKLPCTIEGLKTCNILNKKGIKTNVTLIFTANQALLAARSGAEYISPFLGRLEDKGLNGLQLINDIVTIFNHHNIKSQLIVASIRNPFHFTEVAKSGAHCATISFNGLLEMTKHQLTDAGIDRFLKDWESYTIK